MLLLKLLFRMNHKCREADAAIFYCLWWKNYNSTRDFSSLSCKNCISLCTPTHTKSSCQMRMQQLSSSTAAKEMRKLARSNWNRSKRLDFFSLQLECNIRTDTAYTGIGRASRPTDSASVSICREHLSFVCDLLLGKRNSSEKTSQNTWFAYSW